jgi:hypothetical protein
MLHLFADVIIRTMAINALISLILVGFSGRVPSAQSYKGDCLIFVLKDCPIANEYSPELKRIIHTYSGKGIQFLMVVDDTDATPQQLFMHLKSYGLPIAGRLDQNHRTAKQLGVTVSPTVVVTKGSQTLYKGRIDDTYPSIGKRRTATSHDLRDALDAFLAGKPVKHPVTKAVGCRLY